MSILQAVSRQGVAPMLPYGTTTSAKQQQRRNSQTLLREMIVKLWIAIN
jgi:hypothetical protein